MGYEKGDSMLINKLLLHCGMNIKLREICNIQKQVNLYLKVLSNKQRHKQMQTD